MKADGIIRRFDDLGRIVIPRALRQQIFGTPRTENMPIEMFVDGDNIILRKYEENKSDDVCEWKSDYGFVSDKYKRETGCGYTFYDLHHAVPFKYCPYCGKKIKVVE